MNRVITVLITVPVTNFILFVVFLREMLKPMQLSSGQPEEPAWSSILLIGLCVTGGCCFLLQYNKPLKERLITMLYSLLITFAVWIVIAILIYQTIQSKGD
jgi:hypothetical protein